MQYGHTERIKLNGQILGAMRRCVLLQALDDDRFNEVVQYSHARKLPENSILFEQGSPLTDFYLLVSGGIKLLRLVPSGNEKVIDIIQPGQTFAEAALFSGRSRYPVTSMTLSPSVVVGFQAQAYMKLLRSSNELCISMMGQLSQRLHWMVNEVDRMTLHNATFRLVDYLLGQIPAGQQHRADLRLSAPKRVIASRLSIKPETFSRILKDLENQGLIHLHGAQVELLDVERLRQLISLET